MPKIVPQIQTLILALAALLNPLIAAAADSRPPNVILIMADDVSWECFGAYGSEEYKTPNIDKLAAQGIRFQNCFSTPICTPTRVKLMTGKYNFRNYSYFGYLDPKEKTFANLLQDAGYKTAIAGKWQLNGLYHGAERSLDSARPYDAGFDEYCLWQLTAGKANKDKGGERFWSPPLEHNGNFLSKEENHEQYGPDIMSDFLCDFIERNKDEPFFAYYPSVLVHDPFIPTPDTIGDVPRDHSANKQPKEAAAKKANFVAMVNYLDKIVGKIVKKVEEVGQLGNTIILFTADNGTHRTLSSQLNGETIHGGKGTTKDMGTHVPFVAYWKGQTPKGVVLEDLIDFTDFYATIAEAAGLSLGPEDPIDGRSFYPQLTGKEGNPRDWVLCHYQPYWGKFPGQQFARNEYYKLYRDGSFYHIPSDLLEANNLAIGQKGERAEEQRRQLALVLETAPPAPTTEGGKAIVERPMYPDWRNIVNPND